MKKTALLFTASMFLGLAGCQSGIMTETKSGEDMAVAENMEWLDDPIVWQNDAGFDASEENAGIEARFVSYQVPEDILSRMTTEALVKSILHFPLNGLYLAYNNPIQYVNKVFEMANVYQELAGRDDAADLLVERFSVTEVLLSSESRDQSDKDYYEKLSLLEESFLEYFLASGLIEGLASEKNKPVLTEAVRRKLEEREASNGEGHVWSRLTDPLITLIRRQCLDIPLPDDMPWLPY